VVEQRLGGQFRVVFPDELQQDVKTAVWPLSDVRRGGT
jgi:hypothetical protein